MEKWTKSTFWATFSRKCIFVTWSTFRLCPSNVDDDDDDDDDDNDDDDDYDNERNKNDRIATAPNSQALLDFYQTLNSMMYNKIFTVTLTLTDVFILFMPFTQTECTRPFCSKSLRVHISIDTTGRNH